MRIKLKHILFGYLGTLHVTLTNLYPEILATDTTGTGANQWRKVRSFLNIGPILDGPPLSRPRAFISRAKDTTNHYPIKDLSSPPKMVYLK